MESGSIYLRQRRNNDCAHCLRIREGLHNQLLSTLHKQSVAFPAPLRAALLKSLRLE